MREKRQSVAIRATDALRAAYGNAAQFREGQLEAIEAVMTGRNSLVVQKTGWGKSLVYFIATRLLRQDGAGPTIIISPLLALMDNQIEAANAMGLDVETINSTQDMRRWGAIYERLGKNEIDALIISPERLGNERFMEQLSGVSAIRLLVVDEAHCISDWGHDFRPDYQRIERLIEGLPANVTVLGTTATANDRVIEDIKAQFGKDMSVVRGDLMRENLAIQVNPLQTQAQRLAWLARQLAGDSRLSGGQGIIYCLTCRNCDMVADYLVSHNISARPYHGKLGKDDDGVDVAGANLKSFMDRKTRVLVATTKLGMGYDKSDIRFVVHFQLPQNLIAYYQQIGRAGRDGKPAYAILLHGKEDEEIIGYFIKSAQASPDLLSQIVGMAREDGVSMADLLRNLNVKKSTIEGALKYLQVHDCIYKDGKAYRANVAKSFDEEAERHKQSALTAMRIREHQDFLDFMVSSDCLMSYVARELDAPDARDACGICMNCCSGYLFAVDDDERMVADAKWFLDNQHATIKPRKKWGSGGNIRPALQMQQGWCLCASYYSPIGQKVKEGKYAMEEFSSELVRLSVDYLRDKVRDSGIDVIVPVTSLMRPQLVPNFARSLAATFGLAYAEAVERTCETPAQKTMENSARQEENIRTSTRICDSAAIAGRRILLVDDMVDSRWTFTVIAAELLEAGAAAVYPYALVSTGSGD